MNFQVAQYHSNNKLRTECKAVFPLSTAQKSLLYNCVYYLAARKTCAQGIKFVFYFALQFFQTRIVSSEMI
jgi:hypothetical protein